MQTMDSCREAGLRASGLHKRFAGVHALRGVDFEVRAGEVMALVGDNGAGKSTLVKLLAGSIAADAGQLRIDGREVSLRADRDPHERGVAIVYQDLAQCGNLDVVDNLHLGQETTRTGMPWRWLPKALRPLDRVGMESQAVRTLASLGSSSLVTPQAMRTEVAALSGGQRQAVAIARSLLGGAGVMLLDEPTAALGVEQTRQVLTMLRRLRDQGRAVVLVTHRLDEVFAVADRITVLRHGRNAALFERSRCSPEDVVGAITTGVSLRGPRAAPGLWHIPHVPNFGEEVAHG